MTPKLKTFIVEDDSTCIMLLDYCLTGLNYEVLGHASTGKEAIIKAKELKPDIILMDILLADEINGIEAARQIKMSTPDVIIIFASACCDTETFSKTLSVGPAGFIDKPYKQKNIRTVMQMAENVFMTRFQNSEQNFKEIVYE